MRKEAESEATPPPTYEKLTVGDRVNHVKFGIGTMIEVIGDEDKELYVVKFAEWGEKRLDPRYVKLVKIS